MGKITIKSSSLASKFLGWIGGVCCAVSPGIVHSISLELHPMKLQALPRGCWGMPGGCMGKGLLWVQVFLGAVGAPVCWLCFWFALSTEPCPCPEQGSSGCSRA